MVVTEWTVVNGQLYVNDKEYDEYYLDKDNIKAFKNQL